MTQSTVTSRTIAVDHIKIESGKKFEEVRRALEETILLRAVRRRARDPGWRFPR
ncbi:MAG: hypothetical protein QOJ15_10900 [Bradyrhizobium sp.]|jgi:hypothetical protein|nr:hypothetical protein [Bradyrhizobium sp.]